MGLAMRLAMYSLLFTCNAAMMGLYVRSMQTLSSLHATVLSLASNTMVSGALGYLLFLEPLKPTWLLGTSCILAGVLLITRAAARQLPGQPTAQPPPPPPLATGAGGEPDQHLKQS
mmetsp:Transcript_28141/g.61760  ORF Transcript_28141/g.61760 Transcript_28141/m.61760 type:complete len:116 (-) Transcript_28141:82-429(-)